MLTAAVQALGNTYLIIYVDDGVVPGARHDVEASAKILKDTINVYRAASDVVLRRLSDAMVCEAALTSLMIRKLEIR